MKKLRITIGIIFFGILNSCNVFDFTNENNSFEYHFYSDKDVYSSQDTVRATFINKSGQTLYLYYQFCTLADMQKLEGGEWKSIPISYGCLGVVNPPVEVKSYKNIKIEVNSNALDKKSFEDGIYRLDFLVSHKDKEEFIKLTSNSFEINK